jgi:hypothetical protein
MQGTYERTAQRLLVGIPRPKPFCMIVGGRLMVGTQSLHRTKQARLWRLFWRLKAKRMTFKPLKRQP